MSNAAPTVCLTSEEVKCAARISKIFAQYGTADTLDSRESNMLSVLGEFAVSKWLYGDIAPVVDHRMGSVRGAVLTGKVRDGHRDLPDAQIDVKCSRDRHGLGWQRLKLMVAPYHVRPSVAYVSAVVVEPQSGLLDDVREVVLCGWTDSCGLAEDAEHLDWWTARNGGLFRIGSLCPEDWPLLP